MKVGDVVRLKSGGPAMTVIEASGDATPDCCFWDNGSFHVETFPDTVLEPAIVWEESEAVVASCRRYFEEHPGTIGRVMLEVIKQVYAETKGAK